MKIAIVAIGSIISAVICSLGANGAGSFQNAYLKLNSSGPYQEQKRVLETLQVYNRASAAFYNSGGDLLAIEELPAAPVVKRRLAKDVNMLTADGLVMVFDKDRVEMKRVKFKNREFATAETREVWAVALQETATRKPVFNLKAVELNVRYFLYKGPLLEGGRRWLVYDVDVYPSNEEIPALNDKAVL